MSAYESFLAQKSPGDRASGLKVIPPLNPNLKPFQRAPTEWALKRGRAALFEDTGLGKALDDDTLVITTTQMKRIADLKTGDQIMGIDGRSVVVTAVFPQGIREACRVTFSDGSSIICDNEHLWTVRTKQDAHRRRPWRTMTLREIRDLGIGGPGVARHDRWFIPSIEAPCEFEDAPDLPLHPYLLGALLGDGHFRSGALSISSADQEIIDGVGLVLPNGYQITKQRYSKYDWSIGRSGDLAGKQGGHHKNQIIESLESLGLYGLLAHEKFIPECYKFSSPDTRLHLLQGLMDTDGSVWITAKSPVVEFSSSSERLARDVLFLIQSLGGKSAIKQRHTNRRDSFRLIPSFPIGIRPFLLSRKAALYRDPIKYLPRRSIRDICEVESRSMTCIKVDKSDGLFLVDGFIATHNTLQQLEWASVVSEHEQGPILGLTPLAVAEQTVQEATKFGIPGVSYAWSQGSMQSNITITNYDRLHLFDPSIFVGVFLDECFAAGTPVDMADGGVLHIEKIRVGDYIKNASGRDRVRAIAKRKISHVVKIGIGLSAYFCSSNHPWFTDRGWVAARNLTTGDQLSHTATAMLLVRQEVSAGAWGIRSQAFLQQELLREMAYEHAGAQGEGSHAGSCGEAWQSEVSLAERDTGGKGGRGELHRLSAHAGGESQSFAYASGDGPQAAYSRGQWERSDCAATGVGRSVARWMDQGICDIVRSQEAGISHSLQSGSGPSLNENCDRGRRPFSQIKESRRRKKGNDTGFSRVESVEILELGHHELDQFREIDGSLYFYDIEAERHPSFSVDGLLVHNSSIIKSHDSKTRATLIETFKDTPWKLCCSATPSPNDYTELGNHAEFLNVMTEKEMLSMFFVHDGSVRAGGGTEWRLKRHAEQDFWRWLSTWAAVIKSPADLGFDEPGYVLPRLIHHQINVEVEYKPQGGMLFPMEARTLSERLSVRRDSIDARVTRAADIVNREPDKPWVVWAQLNKEADALVEAIPGAVQVAGSDEPFEKKRRLLGFCRRDPRVLVTKPKIGGWGMNWQHCADMVFVGLNDSFEQLYQAKRRCWRYGQTRSVNVYMIASELEGSVVANLERKEREFEEMQANMTIHMRDLVRAEVLGERRVTGAYAPSVEMEKPGWMI